MAPTKFDFFENGVDGSVWAKKTSKFYGIFQSPNIVSSLPPSACKAFPLLSFDLLNVLSFGRRLLKKARSNMLQKEVDKLRKWKAVCGKL